MDQKKNIFKIFFFISLVAMIAAVVVIVFLYQKAEELNNTMQDTNVVVSQKNEEILRLTQDKEALTTERDDLLKKVKDLSEENTKLTAENQEKNTMIQTLITDFQEVNNAFDALIHVEDGQDTTRSIENLKIAIARLRATSGEGE